MNPPRPEPFIRASQPVEDDDDIAEDIERFRQNAAQKRPASLHASQFVDDEALEGDYMEDDDDSDGQPDLARYFSQWDISPKEQILMCRGYANYLSSMKQPFATKK